MCISVRPSLKPWMSCHNERYSALYFLLIPYLFMYWCYCTAFLFSDNDFHLLLTLQFHSCTLESVSDFEDCQNTKNSMACQRKHTHTHIYTCMQRNKQTQTKQTNKANKRNKHTNKASNQIHKQSYTHVRLHTITHTKRFTSCACLREPTLYSGHF